MKTRNNFLLSMIQDANSKSIKGRLLFKYALVAIVIVFTSSTTVQSQVITDQADVPIPKATSGSAEPETLHFEASLGAQSLSDGYGDWKDLNFSAAYNINQHVLRGEVSMNRRFNQDGVFVGVGDTHTFNDDWYGSVSAGAGDGTFYLPRYRADATIYKKMLADRRLVASLGAGYYRAPDGHTDNSLSLGLVYYFPAPWIIEGGVRFNRSLPGSVQTRQQYIAATYGQDKHDLVIARYGWGTEGYLAIAANSQLVNFKSSEASLAWRHWFNSSSGLFVSVKRYANPAYRRSGLNIGVFKNS